MDTMMSNGFAVTPKHQNFSDTKTPKFLMSLHGHQKLFALTPKTHHSTAGRCYASAALTYVNGSSACTKSNSGGVW
jgi:hypothetical protein